MSIYQRVLKIVTRISVAGWSLLIPFSVIADETEIFYQADAAKVNANVLFLMDASGSMDQVLSDSSGKTRMKVMQETFRQVMSEAPSNLNIGLMSYANAEFLSSYQWDSVKGVNFPISPINAEAAAILGGHAATDNLPDAPAEMPVRDFLSDVVDSWQPAGYTPIVDSLYEAARYFRGEESVWGKYPPAYNWAAHPASYTGTPTCENPQTLECRLEWGECNGTQTSCEAKPVSNCCNWVEDASGGYCVDDNYSCSIDVSHCQHTVCDSVSGSATYKSPLEHSCQANFLVLMSDGKPEYPYYTSRTTDGTGQYAESAFPDYTHDSFLVPALNPVIDGSDISTAIPALISNTCADQPSGYASGTCGPELTNFLATSDQSTTVDGTQTVETFTVAFGMADEPAGTAYLASLATAEDGAYTADNAEELAEAFKDVFGEIEKKSYSFSSPSFSVSEDSLLSNGSDVYVPVFDSKRTPLWSGNLRKFTLSTDGDIVGVGNSASLTSTGDFDVNAQDLWSAAPHGSDVKVGGAANQLPPPASRVRRTDAGGNTLINISSDTPATVITPAMLTPEGTRRTQHGLWDFIVEATGLSGKDGLSRVGWYNDCDGNKVTVGTFANPATTPVNIEQVTTCLPEEVTVAQRDTLLDFARGYERTEAGGVDTSSVVGRKHMGDMLNSKPIVVKYADKSLVLIATNEGYLHALNASTGVEEWAFMPSPLLKNQSIFFDDTEEKKHVYGIDGPLTLWNHDADKDGVITAGIDSDDKRLLFFGLRRGGNMYYALDITSSSSPSIVWKISPDTMPGAITTGFSQLGETWSKPALSKMRVASSDGSDSESKYVLVFGGGYDAKYDEQDISVRASGDALGSDVYIVDAETGALLWSAKGQGGSAAAGMTHSIAGDIRILDMDNNGELDRLYFADLGGNIWRTDLRVDVSSSGSGVEFSNTTELTKLASLGDTANASGTDGDHRKFFYEPDTALRMRGGETIMTISIGSGYRTHPLDLGDNDNFYVLIDRNVYEGRDQSADAVITHNDLEIANSNGSGFGGNILDGDKKGWYMPLGYRGEKVLATSLTFLDKVLFTTFAQADASGADSVVGPCSPLITTARAYALDLLTGKAVANLNRVETTDAYGNTVKTNDPFVVAGFGEILDTPQLIFSALSDGSDGDCTKTNCHQSVSVRIGKLNVPVLDLANTENTTNAKYSEMVDLTKLLPRLYWRDDEVSYNDADVVSDDGS